MSDVVLACSPCDDARTEALLRLLRAAAVDVDAADDTARGPDAARRARCVVVAWSACSVELPWMRTVAREGARREVLVSVLLDDVLPPVRARAAAPIDLRDWTGSGRHPGIAALRAGIGAALAQGDEPWPPLDLEATGRPAGAAPPDAADSAALASPADGGGMDLAAAAASAVEAVADAAPRLAGVKSRRLRVYRRVATFAGGLALVGQILSSSIDVFDFLPIVPPNDPTRLVVGVMNVRAEGDAPGWAVVVTRDRLNAILNRFGAIEVMSKQQIAFVQDRDEVSEIEAARRLGIERMISGTLSVVGRRWKLMVEVVDPARGSLTQTEEEEGSEETFAVMHNRLAARLVRRLGVKFEAAEIDELVRLQPMADADHFRRLMESMGEFPDEPAPPPGDQEGRWHLLAPASAAAASPDEDAIRRLLEEYRQALEAEDMRRLDRIHVADDPRLRGALARYLANADHLDVDFSDVVVAIDGDTALATFTRRDAFRDAATGQEVRMELRVSNALVRRDGTWLIQGAKR
ncbi:MAG: nuclear transport factor 2 family protein [bacterium]|nr:nuclear transport factor 2 family protein [bacterium]